MLLKDKRLLITGVRNRRSLAHAAATSAAAAGARLAFAVQPAPADKSHDKTAAILQQDFPAAPVFPCDAAQDAAINTAVSGAAEALGGLDGLVHAIAFAERDSIVGGYHEGITRENFALALDISAYTFTAFAKAALPHLPPASENNDNTTTPGGGSFVTLTYLGAERALPNYNVMGVAKAALEASVRYLAFSMGRHGARVNAVSAGPVKTLAAAGIGDFGKILKHVAHQAPLKRNISASEVGDACAFLLSDMARGISGEILHVDAGFHITAGFTEDDPAPAPQK